MAKRSSRADARAHEATVEPLFGGVWRPPTEAGEPEREQSYVRKVRPQGENQRALMAAIAQQPLTLALGPAGTGKTYLAISAAVDAILHRGAAIDAVIAGLLSRPFRAEGPNS